MKEIAECHIYLLPGLKIFLVSDATEIKNVIIFQLFSFGKFLPWKFAFIALQQEAVNFQIAVAIFTWVPPFSCSWI